MGASTTAAGPASATSKTLTWSVVHGAAREVRRNVLSSRIVEGEAHARKGGPLSPIGDALHAPLSPELLLRPSRGLSFGAPNPVGYFLLAQVEVGSP